MYIGLVCFVELLAQSAAATYFASRLQDMIFSGLSKWCSVGRGCGCFFEGTYPFWVVTWATKQKLHICRVTHPICDLDSGNSQDPTLG